MGDVKVDISYLDSSAILTKQTAISYLFASFTRNQCKWLESAYLKQIHLRNIIYIPKPCYACFLPEPPNQITVQRDRLALPTKTLAH